LGREAAVTGHARLRSDLSMANVLGRVAGIFGFCAIVLVG
jgi:hypothetical protein